MARFRRAVADLPVVVLTSGTDHVAGIPADERERIFDMFYRGPGRRGAGAGLGLAICRRSIESLGGTIAAVAGPLGGCRVRFTLPDEPIGPSRECRE